MYGQKANTWSLKKNACSGKSVKIKCFAHGTCKGCRIYFRRRSQSFLQCSQYRRLRRGCRIQGQFQHNVRGSMQK